MIVVFCSETGHHFTVDGTKDEFIRDAVDVVSKQEGDPVSWEVIEADLGVMIFTIDNPWTPSEAADLLYN